MLKIEYKRKRISIDYEGTTEAIVTELAIVTVETLNALQKKIPGWARIKYRGVEVTLTEAMVIMLREGMELKAQEEEKL